MSDNNSLKNEKSEEIKEFGAVVAAGGKHKIYCLTIIGEIEGHTVLAENSKSTKYEHIIPSIAAVEESDDIDGVLVLLNTVGGDVEAGLAIAEMIAGMTKPTVTLVLGGGHSIGIPLAVSAKVTVIAPSASMTIHPVRMSGTMIAAPQTYGYFERIQDRIIRFVSSNSRISAEAFKELMLRSGDMSNDVGSIIYGEEAVALGLMDRVGTLCDALKCLYTMIDENRYAKQ